MVDLFSPGWPISCSRSTTGSPLPSPADRSSSPSVQNPDSLDIGKSEDNADFDDENDMPKPRPVRAVSLTSKMALRASEAVAQAVATHRAQQEMKERAAKSLVAAIGNENLSLLIGFEWLIS